MKYLLSRIKLRTEKCIKEVLENGQIVFSSKDVVIYALKVCENEGFKFAVITAKECGNSVKRNRIKRLTREYFRLNQRRIKNFYVLIRYKRDPGFRRYCDAEKFFEKIFAEKDLFRSH
ncbi:MAG: ribonuclease P protein component [Elusimicrobiales bacterium]